MKYIYPEKKRFRILIFCFIVMLSAVTVFLFAGCQPSSAEYTITVKGSAAEAGVIQYAGLEMNVYQDQAQILRQQALLSDIQILVLPVS